MMRTMVPLRVCRTASAQWAERIEEQELCPYEVWRCEAWDHVEGEALGISVFVERYPTLDDAIVGAREVEAEVMGNGEVLAVLNGRGRPVVVRSR